MLNKHGQATVYFGVDDDGDVCGLSIGKNTLMDIRGRIQDKIKPRIYADIQEQTTDDEKTYIKITASGADIPYSFDGRYYLRNVSADERASNDILRKMLAASDSDIIRQKTSPKQNLTFSALFAILEGRGVHPKSTNEFYANYGLLNRDGKFNVNAYLLSDDNEISLKVVTFDGMDKSVMSRRTEYGGRCLLVSVSEVMRFFEMINVTNVNLKGTKREEFPLFDYPSSERHGSMHVCTMTGTMQFRRLYICLMIVWKSFLMEGFLSHFQEKDSIMGLVYRSIKVC